MNITERICSNGHGWISPSFLVVHSTADPGADSYTLWRYWSSGQTQYQVHYCVDWKGICYHCVPDTAKAYHCGNGNSVSIGIEICEVRNSQDFIKSWNYAVDAVATILKKKGWGTDRMKSHQYMSRTYGGSDHTDPIPYFLRYGKTWDQFVSAVKAKLNPAPAKKEETKEVFDMAECIFFLEDDHKLPNGKVFPAYSRIFWTQDRGCVFCGAEAGGSAKTDGTIKLLKKIGVPVINSNSKTANWITEAYKLTDPSARATFGDTTLAWNR